MLEQLAHGRALVGLVAAECLAPRRERVVKERQHHLHLVLPHQLQGPLVLVKHRPVLHAARLGAVELAFRHQPAPIDAEAVDANACVGGELDIRLRVGPEAQPLSSPRRLVLGVCGRGGEAEPEVVSIAKICGKHLSIGPRYSCHAEQRHGDSAPEQQGAAHGLPCARLVHDPLNKGQSLPTFSKKFIRHVAAVICRENSRMICSATRMRPAGSRVVARGRSPGERA
eukprot:scaffold5069_cov115-Isochrysis_galbana.AAC.3